MQDLTGLRVSRWLVVAEGARRGGRVMFGAPNKVQRDWREDVRALGSAISGMTPCEIHHCAGRTAKHNKIHVGHWWILPLTKSEHDEVPTWAHGRKEREKYLFDWVCRKYRIRYRRDVPFGDEVYNAIMGYRK